ncbi:CAVP-target protein-like [Tachypleus tridentatus]|uniref:CAVP-target protein-like n=1 Tax=Tachypleus tridentatus TaxID=6853 RepID=UPI003FD09DB9
MLAMFNKVLAVLISGVLLMEAANVDYMEAPKFTFPLFDLYSTSEQKPVHLETRVTPANDPNLTIKWFKNGQPLQTSLRITISFDNGVAVLYIHSAILADSGVYVCQASNTAGEATTRGVLSVTPI